MGFHDVQFPPKISLNSRVIAGYSTFVHQLDGGGSERVMRWSSALRAYDASYGIRSRTDFFAAYQFFLARGGPANAFRWKDWLDYTTAADGVSDPTAFDQDLGVGDGSTTQFQLKKSYMSGPTTVVRNLEKPVAGTVLIGKDDVAQGSGWSVDTATGIVTFTTAPAAAAVLTSGCRFDVPARFRDDQLELVLRNPRQGSLPAILIDEERSEIPVEDEYFAGGGSFSTLTANAALSLANGRAQVFKTTTAGLILITPDNTNLPLGGPYFYLLNDPTSTQSIVVKTGVAGSTVATLAAGAGAELYLGLDSGGLRKWYAL